jgi:hypothetical protein
LIEHGPLSTNKLADGFAGHGWIKPNRTKAASGQVTLVR